MLRVIGPQLGAIQLDVAELDQPRRRTQRQNLSNRPPRAARWCLRKSLTVRKSDRCIAVTAMKPRRSSQPFAMRRDEYWLRLQVYSSSTGIIAG